MVSLWWINTLLFLFYLCVCPCKNKFKLELSSVLGIFLYQSSSFLVFFEMSLTEPVSLALGYYAPPRLAIQKLRDPPASTSPRRL